MDGLRRLGRRLPLRMFAAMRNRGSAFIAGALLVLLATQASYFFGGSAEEETSSWNPAMAIGQPFPFRPQ
eukprot:m.335070 g.335070  ORF g.335070 m.335070 type:complete len:70 (-) comp27762_c0_seq14:3832-4041(-)